MNAWTIMERFQAAFQSPIPIIFLRSRRYPFYSYIGFLFQLGQVCLFFPKDWKKKRNIVYSYIPTKVTLCLKKKNQCDNIFKSLSISSPWNWQFASVWLYRLAPNIPISDFGTFTSRGTTEKKSHTHRHTHTLLWFMYPLLTPLEARMILCR